jgi:putative oxidoreductase
MQNLLYRLTRTSPRSLDAAILIIRLCFGLTLAFAHGASKVANLWSFAGKVAEKGVPLASVLGPAAALSEFVGGLLLAVGLVTRPAAVFVLITMLVAALHFHAADPFSKKELALSYAAVALALLVAGPGRFSVDARLARRTA